MLNGFTEMNYLHLFTLLLAITCMSASTIYDDNYSYDDLSSEEWSNREDLNSTRNAKVFDSKQFTLDWRNDLITLSKEIGKQIGREVVRDVAKVILGIYGNI